MTLENVQDRRAYYSAGEAADPYFAADLVTPEQEGAWANLAAAAKLIIGGTRLLMSVGVCAAALAPPDCLGSPFPTATEEMREKLAAVDASPKLRSCKDKVVAIGNREPGLVVLLPNPGGHTDKAVVQLHIALRMQFGRGPERCAYQQSVIVELKGDTYEEAIARELSGSPRPLAALHPRLE